MSIREEYDYCIAMYEKYRADNNNPEMYRYVNRANYLARVIRGEA